MTDRDDSTAPPASDWLERALQEDGRAHRAGYLADDGFTVRVTAALPAPATLPAWRRPAIALLWTVCAGGVALALPDMVTDVMHATLRLLGTQPVSLSSIATAIVALGVAAWAGAVYLLQQDD